ncbi:hypothetical protein BT93_D0102 [Corymbia citriodora subsp. variegata]|nr:hypothetical protein BT93_D0102 [Corymbia citriodora subsp. variegata]
MRPNSSTISSSFSRPELHIPNTLNGKLAIAPVGIRKVSFASFSSNHRKRVKLIKLQIPSGNDSILSLSDRSNTFKQAVIDSKNPLGTSLSLVSLTNKVLSWEHIGGVPSIFTIHLPHRDTFSASPHLEIIFAGMSSSFSITSNLFSFCPWS